MNPQQDQTPGLGLPQPSFDAGQSPVNHTPDSFRAPAPTMPNFGAVASPMPQAPAAPVAQSMPAIVTQLQQPVTPSPVLAATISSVPAAVVQADDNESALDEEWVNKAREIVERTHTDPYLQSRELGRIKAQYIKARYNKDIKSSEDPS